jgi:sec-independent protein translocase protein TatB
MFDIGPSELLLIFVVALLVIGPERLPSAVKTASLWVGRFRRSFHKIKAEVERELNADEIRRQLHNESILAEVEDAKNQAKELVSNAESAAVNELGLESSNGGGEKNNAATAQGDAVAPEQSTNDSGQQVETTADTQATGSNQPTQPTVGDELKQAVSYVNDISREVEASAQEIEDKIRNPGFASKKKSSDKS